MRYIECYCPDCKATYSITFKDDVPDYTLTCIMCGCMNVKYSRIDPNGSS